MASEIGIRKLNKSRYATVKSMRRCEGEQDRSFGAHREKIMINPGRAINANR